MVERVRYFTLRGSGPLLTIYGNDKRPVHVDEREV